MDVLVVVFDSFVNMRWCPGPDTFKGSLKLSFTTGGFCIVKHPSVFQLCLHSVQGRGDLKEFAR